MTPESMVVLRQFRVLFNAVKSHFQYMEKQAGIGGAQLWALSVVAERDGLGVSELAQAMDVHQSTASNLVRALVGKGLLVSQRDEPDRRAVRLSVTRDGAALLRTVPGPWAGVLPEALQQLDAATLARLHADLGALIQTLGEDAASPSAQTPLAEM